MKKTLAIILSVLFLFSMVSGGVLAEGDVEQTLHLSYGANLYNTYDFYYPWSDTGLTGNLLWLTLLQADKDLAVTKGEIMKEWTVSDDGLTYTFTMNDDLLWSDGTPITMDDILWTFDRYCDKNNASYWPYVINALRYIEGYAAYNTGEAESITGISAEGNVLTIKLTGPYASFLNLMAQVAPLPKHIYENCHFDDNGFKTDPIWESIKVNSGPFVITEHVPGSYYILEPNPNYKGEASKITKVICTATADAVVEAQAGKVDMLNTNDAGTFDIMSDLSDYSVNMVPIIYFRFLGFNFYDVDGNKKDFVSDVRVRQAIAMAIDWATVIDGLYGDMANLTQTGVLSGDENYAGDWYSYDPDGAKALLDEAGFDYNHAIKLFYYYSDQTTIDLMDALAYYFGQIGVTLEAVYTSNSLGDIYEGKTHDIAYWGLSAYDNLSWYQMYMRDNQSAMLNSQDIFRDAVADLETAYTPEMWKEAIAKLQEMDKENIFFLPVYTLNYQVWVKDTLSVPEDCFGNTWYFYDYQFESWEIVK